MLKLRINKIDHKPKKGDMVICTKFKGFESEGDRFLNEDEIKIGRVYTLKFIVERFTEEKRRYSKYKYQFEGKDHWHPSSSFKIYRKC